MKLRVAFGLLSLLMLSACGLNAPFVVTEIVTLPPPPTNTLAPLPTTTLRYTATPIPTSTMIPTNTLPPTATPLVPTVTPFVPPTSAPTPITGQVSFGAPTVRLREAPSTDAPTLGNVREGTPLSVIGASDDKLWYYVILSDGRQGWMSAEFVTVSNPAAVAIVSTLQLTARAEQPTRGTPVAGATRTTLGGTAAPTIAPRTNRRTDILAYCDLPSAAGSEKRKSFRSNEQVSAYWSWFAVTEAQVQDHIDAGTYEVTLELKDPQGQWVRIRTFDEYPRFRTAITRSGGRNWVYWFVPMGTLLPGEYRLTYKLTWSKQVDDGEKTFGPGGDEEVNTGNCVFTVRS